MLRVRFFRNIEELPKNFRISLLLDGGFNKLMQRCQFKKFRRASKLPLLNRKKGRPLSSQKETIDEPFKSRTKIHHFGIAFRSKVVWIDRISS
jgi:hypothetical protein